jgi:hypothetical protein
LLVLSLALSAGCQGYLEFGGQTHTVTLEALPDTACPAGWTGDTVPAAHLEDLEGDLTHIFADIGEQADSEIISRNAGAVDALRLVSLSLQMADTSNATDMQSSFGFLAGIEIYAESSKVDSNLPRVLVAWTTNIPEGATTLPLQISQDVDLHPYRVEGLRITTDLVARSCLRREVSFRASYLALVRPTH